MRVGRAAWVEGMSSLSTRLKSVLPLKSERRNVSEEQANADKKENYMMMQPCNGAICSIYMT